MRVKAVIIFVLSGGLFLAMSASRPGTPQFHWLASKSELSFGTPDLYCKEPRLELFVPLF